MDKVLHKEFLLKNGLKEGLIDKLKLNSLKLLYDYAHANSKVSKLMPTLLQLASLEVQNKEGAIYLMINQLATIPQLKSLTPQQISQLVEEHQVNQDNKVIIKNVKRLLVTGQQQKLFTKTDGIKGEFNVDPSEKEN